MKKLIAGLLLLALLVSATACHSTRQPSTVSFEKGATRVIAHRGLSALEVENTEAAFVAAGEGSYFGIEGDVRKTADGKFVMSHDETLLRLSGINIPVETSALDELLEVPLLDKDGGLCGEARLCELGTYISICKTYKKEAILELKSAFSEEEIASIIEIIRSYDYIDGVTFISFRYENLEHVRRLLPEQSVQLLCSKISEEIVDRLVHERIDLAISHLNAQTDLQMRTK